MLITKDHPKVPYIEIRTKKTPGLVNVTFHGCLSFDTVSKEAEFYGRIDTTFEENGVKKKQNRTAVFSKNGKTSILPGNNQGDFELVTFKCHLPYGVDAYWRNTDIRVEDEPDYDCRVNLEDEE